MQNSSCSFLLEEDAVVGQLFRPHYCPITYAIKSHVRVRNVILGICETDAHKRKMCWLGQFVSYPLMTMIIRHLDVVCCLAELAFV